MISVVEPTLVLTALIYSGQAEDGAFTQKEGLSAKTGELKDKTSSSESSEFVNLFTEHSFRIKISFTDIKSNQTLLFIHTAIHSISSS